MFRRLKQKSLEVQLDDLWNTKIRLIPIIQVIIFCGRYNIILPGHRDDVNLKNLLLIEDTAKRHVCQ